MTDAPKISLNQQLEAVAFAIRRQETITGGGNVRSARPKSAEQYDLDRLIAAKRTLEWLRDNMDVVREFAALKPDVREVGLAMAREIARKQTIAAVGGPVR